MEQEKWHDRWKNAELLRCNFPFVSAYIAFHIYLHILQATSEKIQDIYERLKLITHGQRICLQIYAYVFKNADDSILVYYENCRI